MVSRLFSTPDDCLVGQSEWGRGEGCVNEMEGIQFSLQRTQQRLEVDVDSRPLFCILPVICSLKMQVCSFLYTPARVKENQNEHPVTSYWRVDIS